MCIRGVLCECGYGGWILVADSLNAIQNGLWDGRFGPRAEWVRYVPTWEILV